MGGEPPFLMNRQATKLEVLLAIAMSSYYHTTHVNYMPVGAEYLNMLKHLRAQNYIKPMVTDFYMLTKKGRDYIARNNVELFKEADTEIDTFIKNL